MGSGHWLWPRKWLNSRHNCQYLTLFWPLFCKFWIEILHLLVLCLEKIDSFCYLKYLHICREFSVFKWAFKWTLRCPCEYWFKIAVSNALTFLLVVWESPHPPQGCLQSKVSSGWISSYFVSSSPKAKEALLSLRALLFSSHCLQWLRHKMKASKEQAFQRRKQGWGKSQILSHSA